MIEWRWGLAPLTVRDGTANNLAEILNFAAPNLAAKPFSVPAGPFGTLCLTAAAAREEWQPLRQMAADCGWPV
jgi:phospholipase C